MIPATILSVVSIVLVYVSVAAGAGLSIAEQSTTGLGNAFAGGAAAAEDASTIYYNPAGLSLLAGSEAIAGLHVLLPSARFNNSGSTHLSGQPLTGGEGGRCWRRIDLSQPVLQPQAERSSEPGDWCQFALWSEYQLRCQLGGPLPCRQF